MHELSLLKDLLKKIESVARENHSQRVSGVKIKLGALSHISNGHFREHFDRAVKGTIMEGARLEVIVATDLDDEHAQEILLESVELEQK